MIRNWKKSTTPGGKHQSQNITKFYEWVGTEVEKKPYFFNCSVGDLFVDINYTTFDDKEELLEELLRSRDKCYCCKDIIYEILPPKVVQLYCNSDLSKYKRGKMRMGTGRLKHQM